MKTKKKQKTMIERLREIRDKISLETMDMNFEEMEEYFRKRREKYENKTETLSVAEPRVTYIKRKKTK
jgi:pyruvate/oxaloacetate carboxyltransferase